MGDWRMDRFDKVMSVLGWVCIAGIVAGGICDSLWVLGVGICGLLFGLAVYCIREIVDDGRKGTLWIGDRKYRIVRREKDDIVFSGTERRKGVLGWIGVVRRLRCLRGTMIWDRDEIVWWNPLTWVVVVTAVLIEFFVGGIKGVKECLEDLRNPGMYNGVRTDGEIRMEE